jgi:hypothetical protein
MALFVHGYEHDIVSEDSLTSDALVGFLESGLD